MKKIIFALIFFCFFLIVSFSLLNEFQKSSTNNWYYKMMSQFLLPANASQFLTPKRPSTSDKCSGKSCIFSRIDECNSLLQQINSSSGAYQQIPSFPAVLHSFDPNHLVLLKKMKHVQVLNISWVRSSSKDGKNVTVDDLPVQNYYTPRADLRLCDALRVGRQSVFNYEKTLNNTFNCTLPKVSKPVALDIPRFYENKPTDLLSYVVVFKNAVASPYGVIFSSEVNFIPHGCHKVGESLPSNQSAIPFYSLIFVISQYWGTGHFHRSVEVIPRLSVYLSFLRKNPHVKIMCPNSGDAVMKKTLEVLGLDAGRMVSGWVRAGTVFLPRPTNCGTANLLETQILALEFRNYLIKKYDPVKRDLIVVIKRTGSRPLLHQLKIENMIANISAKFNLKLQIFDDRRLPAFNETMLLFYRALAVVAPHGAGLSNIIYSQPGTLVLEGLVEMWHANLCYERLAYLLGMRWYGMMSKSGGAGLIDVSAEHVQNILTHYLKLLTLKP